MKPYPLAPEKYLVGTDGTVKRLNTKSNGKVGVDNILTGRIRNKDGRKEYCLFISGKRVYKHAHTMVLETYIGPRPEGMECCHADGNPLNNHLDNLRWGTRKDNASDRSKHGTQVGSKHPRAVFNEHVVRQVRKQYASGTPIKEIAAQLDCPYVRVWMIVRGKNWKQVI